MQCRLYACSVGYMHVVHMYGTTMNPLLAAAKASIGAPDGQVCVGQGVWSASLHVFCGAYWLGHLAGDGGWIAGV